MSQPDQTCQILSVWNLTALTDLFLATMYGSKTRLTIQQPTILLRPVTKSSLVNVEYYIIKGKEMLVCVKHMPAWKKGY